MQRKQKRIGVVVCVLCVLLCSVATYADEIVSIYCGEKTTAKDLQIRYSGYNTKDWAVVSTSALGITYEATLRCGFDDGIFHDYDFCYIYYGTPHGVLCMGGAFNSTGKGAFTDAVQDYKQSSIASIEHTGNSSSFSCIFGANK